MDTFEHNAAAEPVQSRGCDPELVARWRAANERLAETVQRLAPGRCEPSAYDHPEIEIARCHAEAARCDMNGLVALAEVWRADAQLIESGISPGALRAIEQQSGSQH